MSLLPWIDKSKLKWNYLSANSGAITFLEDKLNKKNFVKLTVLDNNLDDIYLIQLTKNTKAAHIVEANLDKLITTGSGYFLSRNPAAVEILKANPTLIKWSDLCRNPNAMDMIKDLLLTRPNEFSWGDLCYNTNNEAIELLSQPNNYQFIDWSNLSTNSSAMDLLKQNNLNNINWMWLSLNPSAEAIELLEFHSGKIDWRFLSRNPSAIHLLEKYPEKIHWRDLCLNPNAMHLIKNNQDLIHWENLSMNPSIFEDADYCCK